MDKENSSTAMEIDSSSGTTAGADQNKAGGVQMTQ